MSFVERFIILYTYLGESTIGGFTLYNYAVMLLFWVGNFSRKTTFLDFMGGHL